MNTLIECAALLKRLKMRIWSDTERGVFVFLGIWAIMYVLLCISYVSILFPFQWIIDFGGYPEPIRNVIVFVLLPIWICVAHLMGKFLKRRKYYD